MECSFTTTKDCVRNTPSWVARTARQGHRLYVAVSGSSRVPSKDDHYRIDGYLAFGGSSLDRDEVQQGPDGLLYLLTDEEAGALLRIEPVDVAP